MRRALIASTFAVALLAGCAPARVSPADAGPAPQHYKAALKAYIAQNFLDPYSLRDVAVSQPVPGSLMLRRGWIVCLVANAKNSMGGYAGLQRTAYLFQGEQIVEAPGEDAIACNGVPLSPWPEMDGPVASKG